MDIVSDGEIHLTKLINEWTVYTWNACEETILEAPNVIDPPQTNKQNPLIVLFDWKNSLRGKK